MSEPKLISPLLDGYIMGEPISDHHGVCCCPAIQEDTDERFIVKIISIPASQVQLDALLLTGAYSDREQALRYFEELALGVTGELDILGRLNKQEGFLPYLDHQTEQMEEGVGYKVYMISPYKRSLESQMRQEPLTHLGAVNLGLDLCAALAACRRAGYLYIDLKPTNIFTTSTRGCCIGDLGFMPLDSLKYASLPEKYRSSYTAPEIADAMASLNDTIDLYALGLVLYQVYNNGQLPFEGSAPSEVLPPPMYADYEMAEIILKACAPNPADRWQDPAQMGQALVNYMQRNSINDTPIVPPPVELTEELIEEETEEFLSEDENEAALASLMAEIGEELPPEEVDEPDQEALTSETEDETDLSFMENPADETVPTEESAADLEDAPVTNEVAEMLAQADELISHELPEPAVAPDPIEIPIPAPIVLNDEGEPVEESAEVSDEAVVGSDAEDSESSHEPESEESAVEDTEEESEPVVVPKPRVKRKRSIRIKPKILITAAIIVVLLAGLITGGYCYYNFIYLQTVDAISIDGSVDTLTVLIDSDIDDDRLTVVCTDTYGNTRYAAVSGGTAQFVGLTPNTQYKLKVEISGFHKLVGSTSGSFTTASQTEILNFSAIAGPEDGSVILNFTQKGPDGQNWSVEYSTASGDAQTVRFTGHTVTIRGLEVGSEYRFRLLSDDELYLIGQCELSYTAQQVVYAQDLKIDACGNGSLSVQWTLPEGLSAQGWIVRCYNDAGFDETITTEDTSAVFTVPDHKSGYTVMVTASGMTQSVSTTVTADPVTITNINVDAADSKQVTISWEFTGKAPESGWVLSFSANGGTPVIHASTNNAVTVELYPGCHYELQIRPHDDISYFCEPCSFDTPEATPFSGYLITADDIQFSMCLTPEEENWNRNDLTAESYRTTFTAGEKASFLVQLTDNYDYSRDEIVITYLIRNDADQPLSAKSVTVRWCDMWDRAFCELDIPEMPTLAGNYVMEIYFNDLYVTAQSFTIT